MRTKSLNYSVITIILLVFAGFNVNSQNLKSIKSNIVVEGTSNIHDWEMTSNTAVGHIESQAGKVSKINIEIPIKSLKSGKGGMDKNAYKALNEDDHPKVKFTSKEVHANKIVGTLSMNGKSKTVSIPISIKNSNQIIKISGKQTINMTDYGVEPPTALMGTIKTGEEVTVNFNFQFKQ
ncbi:YceI family protein [Zunongwangia endophytica]|uniref:YceI family protein n=1 Tax=Zunongwangia endophytica TaxID=1808945 RepID=A0ABV8HC44_9FLAO|nr:YceI family protein [Zunongwangia endophytica]MDN3596232.1 YceI family protein [Zunongwangia endophytica]